MHPSGPLLAAGLAALAALPPAAAKAAPKDAILLSKVNTLTLRSGKMTTARRVPAVPQLTCRASPQAVCDLYDIDVMRCTNQGSSYGDEDIEWSCTAALPAELKLGGTEVSCEGYSSSDDPFVLKGSCAVEYRLLLTDFGEARYPELAKGSGLGQAGATWFFWLVFLAILAWILYSAYSGRGGANQGGAGGWGGWGGWGGGGGPGGGFGPNNDPPPPYPGHKPSWQQQQQGWRPGFWSGLATGAAGAYMANRNNNRQDDRYYGVDRDRRRAWGGGSSVAGPSSRPVSTTSRPSTGFGSTSRR